MGLLVLQPHRDRVLSRHPLILIGIFLRLPSATIIRHNANLVGSVLRRSLIFGGVQKVLPYKAGSTRRIGKEVKFLER